MVGSDYLKTASNVLKLSSIKPGFPRVFVKLKPIVYRATRIFSPFFVLFFLNNTFWCGIYISSQRNIRHSSFTVVLGDYLSWKRN